MKNRFFEYLSKINPLFDEKDVLEYRIYREPYSQPIVFKEFSKLKLDYRTPVQGLYLANMSMIFPEDRGMSYSVKIANEASKVIIQDIDKA